MADLAFSAPDFSGMTPDESRKWISDRKVLFFTNSRCEPGGLLAASLGTWLCWVPFQNFAIIPGSDSTGRPLYGYDAFNAVVSGAFSGGPWGEFKAAVNIDEDAFVVDFPGLLAEVSAFLDGGFCLCGPQDGGAICHRNHSRRLVNSFVSFWNVGLLRRKARWDDLNAFGKELFRFGAGNACAEFWRRTALEKPELLAEVESLAEKATQRAARRREGRPEVPYASVVRHDAGNPVEPSQEPWTWTDGREARNFEPYYVLEELLLWHAGTPLRYLDAADYSEPEKTPEADNSGLTSAVYSTGPRKNLMLVHSWYAREYTKFPRTRRQLEQTRRINRDVAVFCDI